MFDYESPVKVFQDEIQMQMENEIMKAICRVGVTVDKEELLKALKYDRGQYEKGYRDGVNAVKWIPCSERLPDKSGYYFACIYNADVDDYDFRKTWFAHVDDYDMEESEWRELYYYEVVTAWQLLPEPYTGEV